MVKIRHLGRALLGLAALFAFGSTSAVATTTTVISSVGTAISNSSVASSISSESYYILRRASDGGTGAGKSLALSGSNFSMGSITTGASSSTNYIVQIGGNETNGYTFYFVGAGTYMYMNNSENSYGTTSDATADNAKFTIAAFTGGNDGGTTGDTYVAISGKTNSSYGFNCNGSFCTWYADRGQQAAYEIVPVEITTYNNYTVTYNLTIGGNAYKTVTQEVMEGEQVPSLSVPFVNFTQPSIVGTAITADQTVDVACTENLPFKVSDDDNTYYYVFDIHSNDNGSFTVGTSSWFVSYDGSALAKTVMDYSQNISATDLGDDFLWYIKGNLINGFNIYSKNSGENFLHKDGDNVACTFSTDASNGNFKIYESSKITGAYCFKIDGNSYYINKNGDGVLQGWYEPDGGSSIVFRPVSDFPIAYYNTNIASYANAPAGALGTMQEADFTAAKAAIATLTNDAFDATATETLIAQNTALAATDKITVPDDLTGFYRLVSYANGTTLSANSSNKLVGSITADAALSDATSIVQFVKNGENDNYSLLINGQYFGQTRQSSATVFPTTSGEYYAATNAGKGKFYLKNTSGGNYAYLHCDGSYNIVGWETAATATGWYIVPATELDIPLNALGDAYYATTYLPFDVSSIEGATAYTGTLDKTAKTLTASTIETTIPAKTAIILKGDTETAKLTIPSTTTTFEGTNDLAGTLTSIAITDDNRVNYLVFGPKIVSDGTTVTEPGFYQYTGSTIPANRAYIDNSSPLGTIRLVFDGETTGINAATIFGGEDSNAPVYDLSGRRVATPVKGGIYLQGGKKFIK